MKWTDKYTSQREDFKTLFDNEQEFVDFMFTQIIMWNYGVYVKTKACQLATYGANSKPN